MTIRAMTAADYESVYALWRHTPGIGKVALVVFRENKKGNAFWEKQGFAARDDLFYRNRPLMEQARTDI